MTEKIDIVYLWVDGADKKWRAEKDKWYQKINNKTPIYAAANTEDRWRDNDELKYSLRSVAECVPWVNHIYIITGFNQVPKWLNTKHPKITIIPHEQIMPKEALPTFNATAIEMCIPNIPNLSERFLLVNDDMFFNRPLSPSFFFDELGRARVFWTSYPCHPTRRKKWLHSVDEYTQTLILSAKIIEDNFGKKLYFGRPAHGIDPYIKSSWQECLGNKKIKEQVDKQIFNKFRTNDEIQRWAFNLYDLVTGRAVFEHAHPRKYFHHKLAKFLYNLIYKKSANKSNVTCANVDHACDALLAAPTFCINDGPNNNTENLNNNRKFLEERFPHKSPFEI
jgi:hypothetical protein